MYLILRKNDNGHNFLSPTGMREENTYSSIFSEDIPYVSQCMSKPGVKVYKIGSLTEVKNIEVTYQEIVKEMTDE